MHILLWFRNDGSKTARNPIATLFIFDDLEYRSARKLGAVVEYNGNNIFAGGPAVALFNNVEMTSLNLFYLFCLVYYDEANHKYKQALLFRLGAIKQAHVFCLR